MCCARCRAHLVPLRELLNRDHKDQIHRHPSSSFLSHCVSRRRMGTRRLPPSELLKPRRRSIRRSSSNLGRRSSSPLTRHPPAPRDHRLSGREEGVLLVVRSGEGRAVELVRGFAGRGEGEGGGEEEGCWAGKAGRRGQHVGTGRERREEASMQ